jgi:hypothetical protein
MIAPDSTNAPTDINTKINTAPTDSSSTASTATGPTTSAAVLKLALSALHANQASTLMRLIAPSITNATMDTDSMINHVPTDFYSIPISSFATGPTTSNAPTLTTVISNVSGIVNKTTNPGIGGNATAAAEQTASPPLQKPTAMPVFTHMKRNATLFINATMVIAFRIKLAPRVFYSILIFSFVIGQKMSRVQKSQKTQLKATFNVFGSASRIVNHGIGGSVTRRAGIAPS